VKAVGMKRARGRVKVSPEASLRPEVLE